MPGRQYISLGKMLENQLDDISDIAIANNASGGHVPDIITFCESEEYIGPIKLRPFQKIMLKVFYRGSRGNENLKLTDEEIKQIENAGLTNNDNGNVLEKYNSGNIFRELILVWGRRGGKDYVSAIIALYEALKLIEIPGGDPHKFYGVDDANPLTILTIATASEQAGIVFQEIKSKLVKSPYFTNKLLPESITSGAIWLLTPSDMIKNKEFADKKLPLTKGAIKVEVGHSNSDSLLGKGIFVLIFDEVASYKSTSGAASGDKLYNKLTPSLTTYVRTEAVKDKDGKVVLDEKGKPKTQQVFDTKLIMISSPRGKEGLFFRCFESADDEPSRLACRLPTWIVYPALSEKLLRSTPPGKDMVEEEFQMEFGAQFSGSAGESFFPREQVEKIFDFGKSLKIKELGEPGIVYFAHLDPATTSHNYALVVVHRELIYNQQTKKADFMIVVDHIKYWHPGIGKPVDAEEVGEYLINLKKRFLLGLVTFDSWNSQSSITNLKKHSIPHKLTHYGIKYKMQIYDELYNLVISNRIQIPYHELLKNEMLNLQRKWLAHAYRVLPKSDGDVRTDDVIDSLCGACYQAITSIHNHLPRGQLVEMDAFSFGNQRMWNSMSGPLGFGTGQEVSRRLEQLASWPNKKRR